MKLNFLDRLSNNPQTLNLMEIRQIRTQFFDAYRHTEGWTDGRSMTKLTVAFLIFFFKSHLKANTGNESDTTLTW